MTQEAQAPAKSDRAPGRAEQALQTFGPCILLVAAAAFHLGMFSILVFGRMTFPFAIDWMEDGGLYEAREIALGHALYPMDGGNFVPYAYPPVYYATVALVSKLTGSVTFGVGRGVSIAGFFGSEALGAWAVFAHARRTLRWDRLHASVLGLAVIALAAGGVPAIRGGFDLARTDPFGGALVIAGLFVCGRIVSGDKRLVVPVAGAALMTLAVYTKQLHLLTAGCVALMLVQANRKSALVYGVALGVFVMGTYVALQSSSHGGFATYVFGLRHHQVLPERAVEGIGVLCINSFYIPFTIVVGLVRFRSISPTTRFWVLGAASTLPGAILAFAKIWGEANNFIPVVMLLPIPTALLVSDLLPRVFGSADRAARAAVLIFAALLVGKLTEEDWFRVAGNTRRRAEFFVDTVGKLDGDVVCPAFPMMPVLGGHTEPQTSVLALIDAEAAHIPNVSVPSYMERLRARHPRYLLLSGHGAEFMLKPMLESDYHLVGQVAAPRRGEVIQLLESPDQLWERNGATGRPTPPLRPPE